MCSGNLSDVTDTRSTPQQVTISTWSFNVYILLSAEGSYQERTTLGDTHDLIICIQYITMD